MYKYLKGRSKEDRSKFCPMPTDSTRGCRHTLVHRGFYLNTKKHFSAVQIQEQLTEVDLRGSGFSIPGGLQEPPGQGSGQSALSAQAGELSQHVSGIALRDQ